MMLLLLALGAMVPQEARFASPVRLQADGKIIRLAAPGYAAPCWHDVDRDGRKDLVVGQLDAGRITVYRGLADGTFAAGTWLQAAGKDVEIPGVMECASATPQFVELNGDGFLDVLSGSFSGQEEGMAGLFHVLWGNQDGTFRAPAVLQGSDGQPLVITVPDAEDADLQMICTRPTAIDLDGDGKLDIVAGNFGGSFAFFQGQGNGKFAPKSTWLQADGVEMRVPHHSDPFLVDWDKDGDFDLLSGSSSGGVFLFQNKGSKTQPKFVASVTLVAAVEKVEDQPIGDDHLRGPQTSTRVWVDDVNSDGKPDLLVGDMAPLAYAQEGVDPAAAKAALQGHRKAVMALYHQMQNADEQQLVTLGKQHEELDRAKARMVREVATGFVWLLLQE